MHQVILLNKISSAFGNSNHGAINCPLRQQWEYARIHHPQATRAMDAESLVHDSTLSPGHHGTGAGVMVGRECKFTDKGIHILLGQLVIPRLEDGSVATEQVGERRGRSHLLHVERNGSRCLPIDWMREVSGVEYRGLLRISRPNVHGSPREGKL